MTNNTYSIPRPLANKLLTLAQADTEAEVCGLISVDTDHNYKVYPIENIAQNTSCVFEMEPQQQINAFKEMRENKASLFAIFHSHPHSDAIPSIKDINDAAYEEALNIINVLDRGCTGYARLSLSRRSK